VRHLLRQESEAIRKNVADNRWLGHGIVSGTGRCLRRKSDANLLTEKQLAERGHHITNPEIEPG